MAVDTPDKPADPIDVTATAPGRAGRRVRPIEHGEQIGRYTILEPLGEGGMGIVYGAYDPDLDRKVALKLLHAPAEDDLGEAGRARLLREARAMARVNHPNVITVYEVDTVDRRDFVAMEFVDGPNLADWLTGPRSWRDILRVFVDAGRGLAAAHRSGLVHRDFKPANVLLTRDGDVRVTDFGLVRSVDESAPAGPESTSGGGAAAAAGGLTMTGAVLGTPAYMSPEQHDGVPADARSDQFGFCAALYEALYGALPYPGETPADVRRAMDQTELQLPKEPPIPGAARRALARGLAVDPAQRFGSMAELLAQLRPSRRSRAPVAAVAAAAAAVIGAIFATAGESVGGDPCDDAASEIRAVWSADAEDQLGRRFGSGEHQLFRRFAGRVDDYTARWEKVAAAACEATHVTGETAEQDYLLQRSCLLERENALATALRVIGRADRRGREQALDIASALPAIDDCTELDALRAGYRPPDSDAARAVVSEVRAELEELRVMRRAFQLAAVRQRAQAAVDRARAIGYSPLVAEALLERGAAERAAEETATARATLREAEVVAEEAGHDAVRAKALLEQVALEAESSSRYDDTHALGRRAAAAIKRYGREPALSARLERYLAQVDLQRKQPTAAVVRLELAVATLADALGPRDPEVADTLLVLSDTFGMLGREREALARAEEALAIRRATAPSNHPSVVLAIEKVGEAMASAGRCDEGRQLIDSVAPFWDSARGKEMLRDLSLEPDAGIHIARGRVVDDRGRPVGGATVVSGVRVVAFCERLDYRFGGRIEARLGRRRAVTGPDGRFAVEIDEERGAIAAERLDLGRSTARHVVGDRPLELMLRPFGRLEGQVHGIDGLRDVPLAVVAIESTDEESIFRGGSIADVRDDGSYAFALLPAGPHDVYVQEGAIDQLRIAGKRVMIAPGKTARASLQFAEGIDLTIEIATADGRTLPSVQVVLAPGRVEVKTVAELNRRLASNLDVQMAFTPPAPARFVGVPPGDYSMCAIPLTGDYRDPEFARTLRPAGVDKLPVHCEPVTIGGAEAQTHRLTLK